MEERTTMISGSVRAESDTMKLVGLVFPASEAKMLYLLNFVIHPYSYSGKYPAIDEDLRWIKVIFRIIE